MEAYQKGDFDQALKDAFIGFDSTLVDPAVVEELKKLAADVMDGSETEDDPDDEENLAELWAERDMDLNDVLEKYKEGKKDPAIEKISDPNVVAQPSPFLRGRRNCTGDGNSAGGPSSSNCLRLKIDENDDAVSSTSKQKSEETDEAASSSGGASSSKNEVASDPSSTNETTKPVDTNCSPVSSSTSKTDVNSIDVQMTNGDACAANASVSSQESEISTNSSKPEKVSSSSQAEAQSNGEITSNSIDKPASNSSISSTKDFDSAESSTEDDDDDEYNEGESK